MIFEFQSVEFANCIHNDLLFCSASSAFIYTKDTAVWCVVTCPRVKLKTDLRACNDNEKNR